MFNVAAIAIIRILAMRQSILTASAVILCIENTVDRSVGASNCHSELLTKLG